MDTKLVLSDIQSFSFRFVIITIIFVFIVLYQLNFFYLQGIGIVLAAMAVK
jgi:hypothetical protein